MLGIIKALKYRGIFWVRFAKMAVDGNRRSFFRTVLDGFPRSRRGDKRRPDKFSQKQPNA